MKKYIYEWINTPKSWKTKFIKSVDAEPECGKDFCDSCGDCLHCYGGDECLENANGKHFWVEYIESDEAA